MSPRYEVTLSWTRIEEYEVEAVDDDGAISAALSQARREDDAPDEMTCESVDEIVPQ